MAIEWTALNCDYTVRLELSTEEAGLIGRDRVKNNVITHVHWKVTNHEFVDDKVHVAKYYGCTALDTSDLKSFIEWEDVTEEIALEWVKYSLGYEGVEEVESELDMQLSISKAELTGRGIPW
jgi:hypothetical protein